MKRNSKIRISQSKTKIQKTISESFYRALIILALFLMTIFFIPTSSQPAYADSQADVDSLTAQISALTVQLNAKRAEAKTFADEVAIYDGKVQQIQLQIQATQAQIDIANSKITNINGEIAVNESKLTKQKESLREYIKVLYEESNTSTLELIASSNSFSDFVDRSEYLQTMQLRAKQIITEIKQLKQQLEDSKNNIEAKKKEIATLQQTQLSQKSELDKEKYGKQILLNQANSQSNKFQNSIEAKLDQKKKIEDFLKNPPPPPPPAPPPTPPPTGGGGVIVSNGQVPSLTQTDPRWSWVAINDSIRQRDYPSAPPSSIGDFGCGITSLAMIFQSYGYNVSPSDIAYNSGYFSTGWGWDWLYWSGIYSASGGRFSAQVSWDPAKANSWAHAGKPFMVGINLYNRYGTFIGNHYVVITGVSGNNWTMNDPLYQGGRMFSYSEITQYVFVN